ncbi:MAG: hypothetical protein COB04_02305 [Gammaproteobacteria bacterium]|nr:MAG: hypothetical protein COB04_02305 [Gammaproteobacteria bacterium]
MNRALTSLVLASGLMASVPLYADNGVASDINVSRPQSNIENVYVGGKIGQAIYDELDDSDIGINLFVGLDLNEIVSAELGWVDFGEIGDKEDDGALEASAFYIAVIGAIELQSDLSAYGKLGFSSWDVDFESESGSGSDSGSDIVFGLGLNYQFSGHSSVQFSIDQYPLDEEDVRVFAIGFKYAI